VIVVAISLPGETPRGMNGLASGIGDGIEKEEAHAQI
jgi:hypothetical protein